MNGVDSVKAKLAKVWALKKIGICNFHDYLWEYV
jgi:hypothetical protein